MITKKRSSATRPTAPKLEGLPNIPSLQSPEPPTFPSFKELVELDRMEQLQPQQSRRLLDLFDGTLGDPTPLVEDFRAHPEKYGNESHEFLEQLASGTKSVKHLSTNERRLLNLATFDYHQALPPKKPSPIQRAAAAASPKGQVKQRVRRAQKPKPRPGIDVPVTELPAYWWMS